MPKYRKLNIRVCNSYDISCFSNIINKYHVEMIERYLDDVSFCNTLKIEIINKIINILKANKLTN